MDDIKGLRAIDAYISDNTQLMVSNEHVLKKVRTFQLGFLGKTVF